MSGGGSKGIALSDRQRIAWLRLIRSDNVGPATFRDLINHCGSAEAALAMLPELSARGGRLSQIRVAAVAGEEDERERASGHGARFTGIGEPDYPPLLRQVDQAPPLLAVKGNAGVFRAPAAAMVGARNASMAGIKLTRQIAATLSSNGYAIVSGLARGIDKAAHEASLAGGTIAALAGGLDKPYPPENLDLLAAIESGRGAAVSEMPFGWEPRARDFPRRNRLIAGLAYGVVVVEAAERSGSLITARLAGEANRLVFAVPGSPLDPRSAGTNRLLKQGAIVVTDAADVLDAVRPLEGKPVFAPERLLEPDFSDPGAPPADSDRERIVELLGPTPTDIDDIIRHTSLRPAQVFLVLLELDLAGRLERHSGGRVSLVSLDP